MVADYLDFARPIFIDYEKFIIQDVDLIVYGTLTIGENIEIISKQL